jgi:hypothetical protein
MNILVPNFYRSSENTISFELPENEIAELRIFDISGSLVLVKKLNARSPRIKLGKMVSGSYLLRIKINDMIYDTRLVKK